MEVRLQVSIVAQALSHSDSQQTGVFSVRGTNETKISEVPQIFTKLVVSKWLPEMIKSATDREAYALRFPTDINGENPSKNRQRKHSGQLRAASKSVHNCWRSLRPPVVII